jgi:hypothetical protein
MSRDTIIKRIAKIIDLFLIFSPKYISTAIIKKKNDNRDKNENIFKWIKLLKTGDSNSRRCSPETEITRRRTKMNSFFPGCTFIIIKKKIKNIKSKVNVVIFKISRRLYCGDLLFVIKALHAVKSRIAIEIDIKLYFFI